MSPSPGLLAQVACILEVTARKPGNVHRFADFDDCTYLDFLLSASAIAGPLDRAAADGVGAAILGAVEATRRVVRTNTNLGMVLLLAPLCAVPEGADLRSGVALVLEDLTVEDARLAYRAIRIARPGGLGTSAEQDVASEPTVTLRDAMRLASGRDSIALQYANGYEDIFEVGLPALAGALEGGLGLEAAIIEAHLRLLARLPDTLIARKRGPAEAIEASRRAGEVLARGPRAIEPDAPELMDFDRWLRAEGHARNPGTTADLACASIFGALRAGIVPTPLDLGAGPIGRAQNRV